MSASRDTLAALKAELARLEPAVLPSASPHFSLGLPPIDEPLGGGLALGALHEVFAAGTMDGVAATGFATALAVRAAPGARIVWVRQDMIDRELGRLHGAGLVSFGLDPDKVILVRARDATCAMKAARDAARSPALGLVIVEIWGEPKILDLTTSRRLSLTASESGVTVLMVRIGAEPAPSAASSRWMVSAAPSQPQEADLLGFPTFSVTLLRHRAGLPVREWLVEWDRDQRRFRNGSTLFSGVDSVFFDRKTGEIREFYEKDLRRIG